MKTVTHFDPLIIAKTDNLFREPISIWVNEFTETSAKEFVTNMSKAQSTGQSIIPVYIDSYGGEAHALLVMIAEIEHSTIPVATIAVGKAMSCGALLLSCGATGHRYMDKNAVIMIHEVSAMKWGKVEELKSRVKYVDMLNKSVYTKMAINCGHDPDYFINEMAKRKNADWFLDAKEAKSHKLVNHVRVPQFTAEVKVNVNFG